MANNNKHTGPNVPALRFPEFSGEWEYKSLGEIGESLIGLTYSPSDVVKEGGTIVFRSSNIQDGVIDYGDLVRVSKKIKDSIITRDGDLLICARNGSTRLIGKNALLKKSDEGQTFGAFMMVFRSIDNRFVHQLLSTKAYSTQVSENLGARINQITTRNFAEYTFGMPQTSEEKEKIGTFLELINDRIETQSKIIEEQEALLKSLTDSSIIALCDGQCKMVPFSELYERAGEGGTPSTSERAYYDDGDIPFIKIDDLKSKYITKHQDNISDWGLHNSSAWIIPENSVIYSNGATIGAVSINTYPISTKQGILGVVPISIVYTEYLYYLMSSTYFAKEINRIVTEGTMKTAYLKDINNILCPLPTLDTQVKIAKGLASLSERLEVEMRILEQYKLQKDVLLSKMFI